MFCVASLYELVGIKTSSTTSSSPSRAGAPLGQPPTPRPKEIAAHPIKEESYQLRGLNKSFPSGLSLSTAVLTKDPYCPLAACA